MPVFTRCVLSWIDPEAGPDDRLTIDLLLDGELRHVVNFGAPTYGRSSFPYRLAMPSIPSVQATEPNRSPRRTRPCPA